MQQNLVLFLSGLEPGSNHDLTAIKPHKRSLGSGARACLTGSLLTDAMFSPFESNHGALSSLVRFLRQVRTQQLHSGADQNI